VAERIHSKSYFADQEFWYTAGQMNKLITEKKISKERV